MTHRSEIVSILIFLSACGDNGGTTNVSTTSPSTATMTQSGTSNATPSMSEDSSVVTDGKTTEYVADTTDTPPTSGTTSEDGGPVFLSFSTNVGKITEGESVTFTALLTDPDGVDDIIGGSLVSEDEMIDYGPFVAAGKAGAFSISVSWGQIHQVAPIAFENANLSIAFRARFFDQGGHKAVKDTEIGLFCEGGAACDGSCTDLGLDGSNCGACGHLCASMACEDGACTPQWSACFADVDGFSTCSEICKSVDATCAEAQCNGYTTRYYNGMVDCTNGSGAVPIPEPCDKIQGWLKPAIKCCCTDSK